MLDNTHLILHTWSYLIDKGYFCIYFIFAYLVFCLVYHQFWELLCLFWSCRWCPSRKIEELAKWSNWESKKQIMARAREYAAAWFYHAATWGELQPKTREQYAAACPNHAAVWQGGLKTKFWRHTATCPNHVAAWQRLSALLFLVTRLKNSYCNTTSLLL